MAASRSSSARGPSAAPAAIQPAGTPTGSIPTDRSENWETLDTSGPLGFHCVAIGDFDGDGRCEILASDDGRGQIKLYKKLGAMGGTVTVVYEAKGGVIFCSAIHRIDVEPART